MFKIYITINPFKIFMGEDNVKDKPIFTEKDNVKDKPIFTEKDILDKEIDYLLQSIASVRNAYYVYISILFAAFFGFLGISLNLVQNANDDVFRVYTGFCFLICFLFLWVSCIRLRSDEIAYKNRLLEIQTTYTGDTNIIKKNSIYKTDMSVQWWWTWVLWLCPLVIIIIVFLGMKDSLSKVCGTDIVNMVYILTLVIVAIIVACVFFTRKYMKNYSEYKKSLNDI